MTDVDVSFWLNSTQPTEDIGNLNDVNDFMFLLDEQTIDGANILKPDLLQPIVYDFSGSSSEDEMLEGVHSSPSSHVGDSNPGSPSNTSDFSDLSPLLNTWSNESSLQDASVFQDISILSQLGLNLDGFDIKSDYNTTSKLPPLPVVEKEDDSRKKKRRRGQTDGPAPTISGFVELSEEELLKLDSPQMEIYIKNFTSCKNVTPSQLKELKRIRRLIKNREYAQSSRNKRKQYIEEIEKKLNDSQAENSNLQDRICDLEFENKSLKLQLNRLGSIIKQDPEIIERLKKLTKNESVSPAPVERTVKVENSSRTLRSSRIAPTVSATLFVILFSFGLFFNFSGRTLQVENRYYTGRVLLEKAETLPYIPSLVEAYAPAAVREIFFSYYHYEDDSSDLDDLKFTNFGMEGMSNLEQEVVVPFDSMNEIKEQDVKQNLNDSESSTVKMEL